MIGNLDEKTIRRHQANATTLVQDPETYEEALSSDQSKKWEFAIQAELEALRRNGTFGEVQELPQGSKTVKCRWVFKTKRDTNGEIIKHKARLVAKGYTQRDGLIMRKPFLRLSQ